MSAQSRSEKAREGWLGAMHRTVGPCDRACIHKGGAQSRPLGRCPQFIQGAFGDAESVSRGSSVSQPLAAD